MRRAVAGILLVLILPAAFAAIFAGGRLIAPNPSRVGPPPRDLGAESVLIPSRSGSALHGWFLPGKDGAVVLLHGLHRSRRSMLGRARVLHSAGYAVLLFDFQANGGSPGKHVTFGYLESLDAQSAVDYLRRRLPGERVGAIGTSMGGAAVILAHPPLPIDAFVAESVYPDLERAVANRLALRFGSWARLLRPLLMIQLRPRLGIAPSALRPIDRVADLRMNKLFIAGSADEHTRIEEARALFEAASEPKAFWEVPGAKHEDLHAFAGPEYERRVLEFLSASLR